MTDLELLELAAKADGRVVDTTLRELWLYEGSSAWNPLHNDGDALRLAVKLGLWISIDNEVEMTVRVIKATQGEDGSRPIGYVEQFKYKKYLDAYSATRRAIVRAAAGIGEKMG